MLPLVLPSHRRWSAACCVRISLNPKALDDRQVAHDLRAGQQSDPGYRAMALQGLVPALVAIGARCAELDAFARAATQRQTDAT